MLCTHTTLLISISAFVFCLGSATEIGCDVSDVVLREIVAVVAFNAANCTVVIPSDLSGEVNQTIVTFRNVTITDNSQIQVDIPRLVNSSRGYFERSPFRLSVVFTNCSVFNRSVLWISGYADWNDLPDAAAPLRSLIDINNTQFVNSTLVMSDIMTHRSTISLSSLSCVHHGPNGSPVVQMFDGAFQSLLTFASFRLHSWSTLLVHKSNFVSEFSPDDEFSGTVQYSVVSVIHGAFVVKNFSRFTVSEVSANILQRGSKTTLIGNASRVVVVRIGPLRSIFTFGVANSSLFRIERTNITSDLSSTCFSMRLASFILPLPMVLSSSRFEFDNVNMATSDASAIVFGSSISLAENSTMLFSNCNIASTSMSYTPTIWITAGVRALNLSSLQLVALKVTNNGPRSDLNYVVGILTSGTITLHNSSHLLATGIIFSFGNSAIFSSTLKYPSLAMRCDGVLSVRDNSRVVTENFFVYGGAIVLNVSVTISGKSAWVWQGVSIVCSTCDSYPTSALTLLSLVVTNESSVAFSRVLFSTVAASPLSTSRNPAAINISSAVAVVIDGGSSFSISDNSTLAGGSGIELMGGLHVTNNSFVQITNCTIQIADITPAGANEPQGGCLTLQALDVNSSSVVRVFRITVEITAVSTQPFVFLVRSDTVASLNSSLQLMDVVAPSGAVVFEGSLQVLLKSSLRLSTMELLQFRAEGAVTVSNLGSMLVFEGALFQPRSPIVAAGTSHGSMVFLRAVIIKELAEMRFDGCSVLAADGNGTRLGLVFSGSLLLTTGGSLSMSNVEFHSRGMVVLSLWSAAVSFGALLNISYCTFAVADVGKGKSGGPYDAAISVLSLTMDGRGSLVVFHRCVVGVNQSAAPQRALSISNMWVTNTAVMLIEQSVMFALREVLSWPSCALGFSANVTVSGASLFSLSDTVLLLGVSLTSNSVVSIQNNTKLFSSYTSPGYEDSSHGVLNISQGDVTGGSILRLDDVEFVGEQAMTIGCFSVVGSEWTVSNIVASSSRDHTTPIAFARFAFCQSATVLLFTRNSLIVLSNIVAPSEKYQGVVAVLAFSDSRTLMIAFGTTVMLSLIRANGTMSFPQLTVTNESSLKIQNCTLEVIRATVFGRGPTPLQFAGGLDVMYRSTVSLEWLELFPGYDFGSPQPLISILFQNLTINNGSLLLEHLTLAGQRNFLGSVGPSGSSLVSFCGSVLLSACSRLVIRASLLVGVSQLPAGYLATNNPANGGQSAVANNTLTTTRFSIPAGIMFVLEVKVLENSTLAVVDVVIITSRAAYNRTQESACILLLADVYVTLHSAFVVGSEASSSFTQMVGGSVIEFGCRQSCSVTLSHDSSLVFDLNARLYQGEERLLGQGVAGVRFTSPTMSLMDGSTCRVSGLIVFVNGTTAVDGIVATLASVVFADASVVKIDTTSGLEFRDLKTGCTLRCALDFAVVLPAVDMLLYALTIITAPAPVSFANVLVNSSRGLLRRSMKLSVVNSSSGTEERRAALHTKFFAASCNRWNNVTYSVEGIPATNILVTNLTLCPVIVMPSRSVSVILSLSSATGSELSHLHTASGLIGESFSTASPSNTMATQSHTRVDEIIKRLDDFPRRLSSIATTFTSMPLILVSGPGAGLAMQRAVMQLQLQACEYSTGDALDVATSPTSLGFGDVSGRYLRGAVVGNLLLIVAVSAGAVFVTRVRQFTAVRQGRTMTLWRAAASLALPGWLVAPFGFLLQPLSTVSIATAVHSNEGSGWTDAALGVLGATICFGLCCCATWVVTWGFAAHPTPISDRGATPFMQLLIPRFRWRDRERHSHFVNHYDSLFAGLRPGRVWFVAVELWASFATGVIGGVMPPDEATCQRLLIAMCVLQVGFLVLAVVAHPSNAALDPILLLNAAAGALWNVVVLVPSLGFVASAVAATQVWVGVLALSLHLVRVFLSGRLRALMVKATRLLAVRSTSIGFVPHGSAVLNPSSDACSSGEDMSSDVDLLSETACVPVVHRCVPEVPIVGLEATLKKFPAVVAVRRKFATAAGNVQLRSESSRCCLENLRVVIALICQHACERETLDSALSRE